jgi:hypothetical protein
MFHLQYKISDIFPLISATHLFCWVPFYMILTTWHFVFTSIFPAFFYALSPIFFSFNPFSLLDPSLQIIYVSFVIVPHEHLLLKLKNRDKNEKMMYDKNIGQDILTLI